MAKFELSGEITISKKEYFDLRCAEERLSMLEAGGVDNWDWYGESLNPEGEKSYSDIKDEIFEKIKSY